MKRTHLDTNWTTLEQLRRRCDSDKIFLTPLHSAPPGLTMRNDSPLQYNAVDQTTNGPYQPAPIRSLRTSTLESYISTGSNHSESPSSSFGGGRFGDSSPEPNAFGGRAASGPFYNDPSGSARGSGFQTTPEIPSAFSGRRGPHAESPIDTSLGMRPGAFGSYGFANPFGSAQGPWGPPSNNFGPGYEAIGPARDAHDHIGLQNYASQGLGFNYGGLRSSQDPGIDSSQPASINYAVGPDHSNHVLGDQFGGLNLASGTSHDQLYSHASQQFDPHPQHHQHPSLDPMYAPQGGFPGAQNNVPAQQSPWPDATGVNVRGAGSFDNTQPTVNNTAITDPTQASPWDQSTQSQPVVSVPLPKDASPWVVASHGAVDTAWKESADASNIDETSVQADVQSSPVDQPPASTISEAPEDIAPEPAVEVSPTAAPSTTSPPTSGKSRKRRGSKEPTSKPAVAPVTTPLPQPEVTSPQPAATKPAWQKEDEMKKAISLREIQEAEAKKAEAKKAAERERERAARAASATSPEKEDIQPFTASWGLPTSQTGSRGAPLPVKEPAPAPAATTPVWTNAPKIAGAKKTMKEILEEEEKRKKMAATTPQASVAAVAATGSRRLYAESSTKVFGICLV